MLFRFLLPIVLLAAPAALSANTLDFNYGLRSAKVDGVKWKGQEYGFSYLLDLNENLALGPYLSSTSWTIHNSALDARSTGDHREFGPELRFVAPLESLNFVAGAAWSIVSKGTAHTGAGADVDVDLAVRGLRFKFGVGIPLSDACTLNILGSKGMQTVELKGADASAHGTLDEVGLSLGLSF